MTDGPTGPRPYGSWYPLVRLGHFVLMILAVILVLLVASGVLGLLALAGYYLTK